MSPILELTVLQVAVRSLTSTVSASAVSSATAPKIVTKILAA